MSCIPASGWLIPGTKELPWQLLATFCNSNMAYVVNTTTRFSSRSSNFFNFTPRIHQKRSQKVRNPTFSWGACPQTPLAGVLRVLQSHTGTHLFKILDPPLLNPTNTQCQYCSLNSYRSAISSVHEIQTIPPRRCIVCAYKVGLSREFWSWKSVWSAGPKFSLENMVRLCKNWSVLKTLVLRLLS